MIAVLWYLISRTTVNRVTRQLKRVRSPRYAVAMLVGVLFVSSWLWNAGSADRMPGGADPLGPMRAASGAVAFLMLLGTVHLWFSRDTLLALAFQPAEVQLLFPAPMSRRVLLAYRVARLQLLVLPNAIFWMFALRFWGSAQPAGVRFGAAWAFFSLLSLHRLGAALVLVPPVRGIRRGVLLLARAILLVAVVAVVAGVVPSILSAAVGDPSAAWRTLQDSLRIAPASIALAPFRLLLAPFSGDDGIVNRFAPLLTAIGAQLLWIYLASTVEFEEAAAHASRDVARRIAAFRRGGMASTEGVARTRTRGRWIRMAPTGAPAVAIVWKNAMSMMRGGVLRGAFIVLVLVAGLTTLARVVPLPPDADDTRAFIGLLPGGWMLMMSLLFGSRVIRNDLRQDLLSLSLLKTYPLRGYQIVLAELALPTLALSAFQAVLVAIMVASRPASAVADFPAVPLGVAVMLAILALGAINATSTTIQNAIALAFPAWVHLGAHNPGVEAMGQSVLTSLGVFFALAVSLVMPAVAGVLTFVATRSIHGDHAIVLASLVGISVLAGEVALMVHPMGRLLERTEPSSIV